MHINMSTKIFLLPKSKQFQVLPIFCNHQLFSSSLSGNYMIDGDTVTISICADPKKKCNIQEHAYYEHYAMWSVPL